MNKKLFLMLSCFICLALNANDFMYTLRAPKIINCAKAPQPFPVNGDTEPKQTRNIATALRQASSRCIFFMKFRTMPASPFAFLKKIPSQILLVIAMLFYERTTNIRFEFITDRSGLKNKVPDK